MEYKNIDSKKITYITCIIISIILCCVFYYLGATYQKKNTLKITESPIINYKVNLEENSYFKTPEDGNTERYISSMIKEIDVNFDYLSKVEEKGEARYKYIIETEVIITDKNDPNHKLWSKKEKIKERENILKDNVNFYDSITIDYQNYNNLVKEFNQSYTLQTEANLYVRCKIEVDGKYDSIKDRINYENEMILEIPLNKTTILITPNVKNNNARVIEAVSKGLQTIQIIYYMVASLFLLGVLYFVIKIVKLLSYQYKTETEYEKKLRKILRNYDDIIVMTQNKPYIKKREVIKVTSFEELLDAQSELREPIIFYEGEDCAKFIIMSETRSYIYTLEKIMDQLEDDNNEEVNEKIENAQTEEKSEENKN